MHREAQPSGTPKQKAKQRFIWFLVGGVANYLLIATPLKYLETHTTLPKLAVSACSVGVSSTVMFFWNYFVNFRTDSRKRDAFPRYVVASLVLFALQTGVLHLFRSFDMGLSLNVGKFSLNLDVVSTQLCFGWLKFLVYHKWAFPAAKGENVAKAEPLPE